MNSDVQDHNAPGAAGHLPDDLLGHLPLQRRPRWREEQQLPVVVSALFLVSLEFISYVGVKSPMPQH